MYILHYNWRHKYVSVHRADCKFARSPDHQTRNTDWSRLFSTLEDAVAEAKKGVEWQNAMHGPVWKVRECAHCILK